MRRTHSELSVAWARADEVLEASIESPHGRASVRFSSNGTPLEASGDALLALGLLPAMRSGQTLAVRAPVSALLLAHVDRIQDIWLAWDRYSWRTGLQRVAVVADARQAATRSPRAAAFFTAGVDSFYTVSKHTSRIDELIFVHGFDVPLAATNRRQTVSEALRAAAAELGKPLIEIETDVQSYSRTVASWDHFHGPALASVAHILSGAIGTVYVAAGDTYATLSPWGSHPVLDPLWSTDRVTYIHDGCEASRFDKIQSLREDGVALRWLRVCWQNGSDAYNCGRCQKCLRTMVCLRAAGVLDRCATFSAPLDLAKVAAMDLEGEQVRMLWRRYLSDLEASGRDPDLTRAVKASLDGRLRRRYRRTRRGVRQLLSSSWRS